MMLTSSLAPAQAAPSLRPSASRSRVIAKADAGQINPSIDKGNEKVAHTVSTKDIQGKYVACRCWRSAKFPNCDGSHMKHNKETGDNVGPLVIVKE